MADQSLAILQKKVNRRDSQSNAVMGLSNSFVDDGHKSGSSGNRDSFELKSMDSSRIRGADVIDTNQEHKKRCFEKLVVRTERMTKENVQDVKCSLNVEVIDDTALIEATAAVSGFKKSYGKETDVGIGSNPGNISGSKNPKQENDGKKRRNKGSKKQGKVCSMKCVKEKKLKSQVVEDQSAKQKKIPDRKGLNGVRKTYPKVKLVYRRKDSIGPNSVATDDVQEHPIIETESAPEKFIGGDFQEPESNLKVSNENEQDSTIEQVETEPVIDKDDELQSNPKKNEEKEEEDQNVCEIATASVESKKMAYTREEMEALRFVNEDEQKNKWAKIYDGFSPSVAKEYTSLLSDMNKQQTQRYNRVANCGSTFNRHAILSMPPVLPLGTSSSYKKMAPIVHTGFRVNFP